MTRVITSVNDLDFKLSDLEEMPYPTGAFMVTPIYFDVEYVINPHMEGHIGDVDKDKAFNQWETVRDAFRSTGLKIHEIEGRPELPDMVFAANQSLPALLRNGKKSAIMSIMHADQRKDEVPYIEQWYRRNGYEVNYLDEKKIDDFEGMGDAIWHSGRRLLWGGYGHRSSLEAYDQISRLLDVPVLALELVSESFYHLDTCFCMLNESSVLIYPEAFTETGLNLIRELFTNVYEAPKEEAEELFACNATCPDGKHVIIQSGCNKTSKTLEDAGFTIMEVDTGEFLKSGGSVFCMKMLVW